MDDLLITSEEILDDIGIKIGDVIQLDGRSYMLIINDDCKCVFMDTDGNTLLVKDIIDKEFKHIRTKKKVGDAKCCDHFNCLDCPLCALDCNKAGYYDGNWSLYRILSEVCAAIGINAGHPVYLTFKAELDKEVE